MRFSSSLFFACLGSLAFGFSAHALSLKEALEAAATNPLLLQAQAQQQAVAAEVQKAKGALLPALTFSAEATTSQQKGSNFITDGESLSATAAIQQPIFQRGLISALKTAKARNAGAVLEVSAATDSLIIQTAGAYADALAAQKAFEQAMQLEETLHQRARATSKGFAAGRYTRTDVAQAESRAATAAAQVASGEQTLESALATLERLAGKSISRSAIFWPQNRTDGILFEPLEVLHLLADNQNPTLLAGMHEVASLQSSVKAQAGGHWPSLTFNASHTRSEDDNGFSADEDSRAGLALSWRVFNGGQVAADVAAAKARLAASEARLDNNKRVVSQQVTSAYYGLRAAKKAVMAQQEAVLAAQLAAEGARKEVQHGRRTILDVLDTEQALADAHTRLASAKATVVKQTYTLLSLVGTL